MFDVKFFLNVWIDSLIASRIRDTDPILKFWFAGSESGAGSATLGKSPCKTHLNSRVTVLLNFIIVKLWIKLFMLPGSQRILWGSRGEDSHGFVFHGGQFIFPLFGYPKIRELVIGSTCFPCKLPTSWWKLEYRYMYISCTEHVPYLSYGTCQKVVLESGEKIGEQVEQIFLSHSHSHLN